jgi:Retrotransposon gag protein
MEALEVFRFKIFTLFPDVTLPENFKLPEFEKYNGESCPMSHVRGYCGDMIPVKSNDQLLIRYFQKSLMGPTLKWFTSLDLSGITSFDHFSNLFIDQYSYNLDMEPHLEDLESLRQEKNESFVTYVGTWRAMAARVKPKSTDEDSINMIIRSALPTISGYLAIQGQPNFPALIKSGARVEAAVNQGLVPALGPQPFFIKFICCKTHKI